MPATNTDLIDRYLHAVKFWLPKAQQADIVAELGEDLQSLVEEREAALGHTLDQDELASILKRRGSPLKVASGYLPNQRLMNPAMLPVYYLVLKIVLLWVFLPLIATIFLGPLLTVDHPVRLLLRCCFEYWRGLFMIVGIVTTVFALFDRYQVKFENWDPRKLPRVPGAQDTAMRWKHLAGGIFGIAAAGFWAYLMWQRSQVPFFFDGSHIVLGPAWRQIYWPVLALILTSAFFDLLASLYPRWTRVRSGVRIGIDASLVIIVGALLYAGLPVEIAGLNVPARDLASTTRWVNGSIQVFLLISAVMQIGDGYTEARRLWRGKRVTRTAVPTAM